MTTCIKLTDTKYTTRPGPPFHANDCKNKIKQGNNGKFYFSKKIGDNFRWVPIKGYEIHHNRMIPYIVSIDLKIGIATIYFVEYNIKSNEHSIYKFKEIKGIKKAYYGKSTPNIDKKVFSFVKGNSILLGLSNNEFIYIGSEIFYFKLFPEDNIINYYSDIGNNDVPYPYLVGKKYIYFMIRLDNGNPCAVEKSYFSKDTWIYSQLWLSEDVKMCKKKGIKQSLCKKINLPEAELKVAELESKTRRFKIKILFNSSNFK